MGGGLGWRTISGAIVRRAAILPSTRSMAHEPTLPRDSSSPTSRNNAPRKPNRSSWSRLRKGQLYGFQFRRQFINREPLLRRLRLPGSEALHRSRWLSSTPMSESATKAAARSCEPMDIGCCDSGTSMYWRSSMPWLSGLRRCYGKRRELGSGSNAAAPQTIAPQMVLHPNPPPIWEEGIRRQRISTTTSSRSPASQIQQCNQRQTASLVQRLARVEANLA